MHKRAKNGNAIQNPETVSLEGNLVREMEETYTVRCGYRVRTTVTGSGAVVKRWISNARYRYRHAYRRQRLVVGLGVQWVPGETSAATLQLCINRKCLIFQLNLADFCPRRLSRFLDDPNVIFAGLGNSCERNRTMLSESRFGLKVRRLVDVDEVARARRGCDCGWSMGRLAARILGMPGLGNDDYSGPIDWNEVHLSADQVKYASHAAFLAFFLAKKLWVWRYL